MSRQPLFWALLAAGLCVRPALAEDRAASRAGSASSSVAVSLSVSPDKAATGQSVTATGSVTNSARFRQRVAITGTVTFPDGRKITKTRTLTLRPGKVVSLTRSIPLLKSYPKGTYTVTVTATTGDGASSTAKTTVQIE